MLCGILFVLHTGICWEFLSQELGFGSGMTCWRRLRDWNEAGVWQHLHELLLSELRAADLLDFSRAAVDSSHIRAMKGGPATGPSPVDRGKAGSKHHLMVTHGTTGRPFFTLRGVEQRCVKERPLEAPRWPVACRDFPVRCSRAGCREGVRSPAG